MTIKINPERINEIAKELRENGRAVVRDFGTLKAKRYKTKLRNKVTKELVEYDSVKLHFVANPKFKKRIK